MLLKLLSQAFSIRPKRGCKALDAATRLQAARTAHREQRFEDAIALLHDVSAREDAELDALYLLADCLLHANRKMAAGKPVLTYASAEAAETGLHGMLSPLLAGESGSPEGQARAREIYQPGGESLYFCAADPAQYAELAVRLTRDAQLRRAAGEANRRFVAEFLSDRGRTARTLATHLVELIAEARGRT
jgi:thioredoxin-like negative regulator of GroEL